MLYENCLCNKDLHISVNTHMLVIITCCVLTRSVCTYVTLGDVYKVNWPWGEGVLVKCVVETCVYVCECVFVGGGLGGGVLSTSLWQNSLYATNISIVLFCYEKIVKESWHIIIICEKNVLLNTVPQWQRLWIGGKSDYFAKTSPQTGY